MTIIYYTIKSISVQVLFHYGPIRTTCPFTTFVFSRVSGRRRTPRNPSIRRSRPLCDSQPSIIRSVSCSITRSSVWSVTSSGFCTLCCVFFVCPSDWKGINFSASSTTSGLYQGRILWTTTGPTCLRIVFSSKIPKTGFKTLTGDIICLSITKDVLNFIDSVIIVSLSYWLRRNE